MPTVARYQPEIQPEVDRDRSYLCHGSISLQTRAGQNAACDTMNAAKNRYQA
jgi:hypothetical protein